MAERMKGSTSRRDMLKKAAVGGGVVAAVWVAPQVSAVAGVEPAPQTDEVIDPCSQCQVAIGGDLAGVGVTAFSGEAGSLSYWSGEACDGTPTQTFDQVVMAPDSDTANGRCDSNYGLGVFTEVLAELPCAEGLYFQCDSST